MNKTKNNNNFYKFNKYLPTPNFLRRSFLVLFFFSLFGLFCIKFGLGLIEVIKFNIGWEYFKVVIIIFTTLIKYRKYIFQLYFNCYVKFINSPYLLSMATIFLTPSFQRECYLDGKRYVVSTKRDVVQAYGSEDNWPEIKHNLLKPFLRSAKRVLLNFRDHPATQGDADQFFNRLERLASQLDNDIINS